MPTPTFLRTMAVVKEQSLMQGTGGANQGNGNDKHIPLGIDNDGRIYRGLLRFNLDFSGVYQIVAAHLVFRSTDQTYHVARGASAEFYAQRLSSTFKMGGGSEGTWAEGAVEVFPGPNVEGATAVTSSLSTGGDVTQRLDMTAIVEAWAPDTVLKSDGTTYGDAEDNNGIRVRASSEAVTAQKYEIFGSMRITAEARKVYLELEYIANRPPLAPNVTAPVEGDPAIVESVNADTLVVQYLFADPDAADTNQRVELEVYGDGATDGAPGTRIATTGAIAPTPLGPLNAFSVTVTGLTPRTNQRYRLRVQDSADVWGPWTSLADGRIFPAYRTSAGPLNEAMETKPDNPLISGSLNSQDATDFISAVEIEVYRDTSAGSQTMWAPGAITIGGTSTRSSEAYQGVALSDGDVLRWRQRHYNRDGIAGAWSDRWNYTTIRAATGPTAMSPISVATKIYSRTPTLTIGHSVSFDGYQWRLYRGEVVLYDSGLVTMTAGTSVNVTVPDGLLAWGDGNIGNPVTWDAAVRTVGGSLGPFSTQYPILINSLPATTLSITGRSTSGYVSSANPTYVAPYDDPDKLTYGEGPSAKEYEIRQAATPAGTGTLEKHITDLTPVESEQLGAAFVPTADQAYDVRVRYRDIQTPKMSTTLAANSAAGATNVKVASVTGLAAGDQLTLETDTADEETRTVTIVGTAGSGGSGVTVAHGYSLAHTSADVVRVHNWGPWSAWLRFTYSAPPSVAANLPADASTMNSPTTALSWTFSGSRAQDHGVVRIYQRIASVDQLIWQVTGTGTGTSYAIPPFLLGTGLTYAWEVTAYDTAGLSGTTTRRTFSTSFSTPAAIADLVATADEAASAVLLAWTASTDPYLSFYRVFWQDADGTWLRVDGGPEALGDGLPLLTTAAFSHLGARIGDNEYRVEASNGSQSSVSAYVSATLASTRPGSWALVSGSVVQMLDPTGAPRVLHTLTETFRPPGRGSAVVLSWGAGGRSVNLGCRYMPGEDGNVSAVLSRLYAAQSRAWLKGPQGYSLDPLLVVITGLEDDPRPNAVMGLSVQLEEVEA